MSEPTMNLGYIRSMIHFLPTLRVAMVALFGCGMPFASYAGGAAPPDINAGRELAETRCAHCHAVGRKDHSKVGAAPAFRELGRKWPLENLAEALAEGIVVGHSAMPAFAFSPAEIDNLLAWLTAIQQR